MFWVENERKLLTCPSHRLCRDARPAWCKQLWYTHGRQRSRTATTNIDIRSSNPAGTWIIQTVVAKYYLRILIIKKSKLITSKILVLLEKETGGIWRLVPIVWLREMVAVLPRMGEARWLVLPVFRLLSFSTMCLYCLRRIGEGSVRKSLRWRTEIYQW